jgi:zinc and cadmium transporter
LFFSVPPYFLVLYLGFFGGFLMYIGASDILPQAHSKHASLNIIALTALGLLFIFIISRVV